MDKLEIFYIVTIVNLVVLSAILLLMPSKKKKANAYLATLLLSITVLMLNYYFWITDFKHGVYITLLFFFVALYLIGINFYFYTLSMMGIKITWDTSKILYIIPFIPAIALYIWFQTKPVEFKIEYVAKINESFPILETIYNAVYSAICCFFFLLSYQRLLKYKRALGNCLSDTEKINLNWLRSFIIILSVVFATVAVIMTTVQNTTLNCYMGPATASFFYLFIFIKTILHPAIYSIYPETLGEYVEKGMNTKKENEKALVSPDESVKIYNGLKNYVNVNKSFLQPKITLKELANYYQVNSHILSYVIKKENENNFYVFINQFRVEEAKKQLSNPDNSNLTIEAIGLQCGFNSKSAFFDVFKKSEEITPRKYRELNTTTAI